MIHVSLHVVICLALTQRTHEPCVPKSLLVSSLLVSLFGNFVDEAKHLKILIGKLRVGAVFAIT